MAGAGMEAAGMMTASAPSRSALKYHGGKWRMGAWILAHMPEHECYVEPFGGAASVLLQKRQAPVEVYNDLSRRVVSFFRVLRERPADLITAIELTPFSREEFALARQPADDELEAARRLYVLSWQGRGGPTARWNTGWRFQRTIVNRASVVATWNQTGHLYDVAARLKAVEIECDDALTVIGRYDQPETLFYCDPPYVFSSRSKWTSSKNGAAYDHEMTDDQHRQLAQLLHGIRGMAMISGRPTALYDELYAGWTCMQTTTTIDTGATVVESLWMNPRAAARAPQPELPFDMEISQ